MCKLPLGAFHQTTQVDTNIILSLFNFNEQQKQNDACVDLCRLMESSHVYKYKCKVLMELTMFNRTMFIHALIKILCKPIRNPDSTQILEDIHGTS